MIRKLHGRTVTNCVNKRHAAHISPFQHHLLPFKPIDGTDNHYSQMHVPVKADPYREANIKGFLPYQLYKEVPNPTTFVVTPNDCKFLSLAELSDEFFPWQSGEQDHVLSDID